MYPQGDRDLPLQSMFLRRLLLCFFATSGNCSVLAAARFFPCFFFLRFFFVVRRGTRLLYEERSPIFVLPGDRVLHVCGCEPAFTLYTTKVGVS